MFTQSSGSLAPYPSCTSDFSFQPADRTKLKSAVEAWCSDSAAVTSTYGDINNWDVSLVTDLR